MKVIYGEFVVVVFVEKPLLEGKRKLSSSA